MVSSKYLQKYMKLKMIKATITSKTYEVTEEDFIHPHGVITVPFNVPEQQLFDWLIDAYKYCKIHTAKTPKDGGRVFKRFLDIITKVSDEVMDITKIHPIFAPKAVEFFNLGYGTIGKGWYRHAYNHGSFYFNDVEFYFEVFTELKILEGVRNTGVVIWSDNTTYEKGVVYPCSSIKPQDVLKQLQDIFGEQIEVKGLLPEEDDINKEDDTNTINTKDW